MGVPGLFPYVVKRFPRCRTSHHIPTPKKVATVDNLYLDANPFLHEAAQKAKNYGQHARKVNPFAGKTEAETDLLLLQFFAEDIFDTISMVVPTVRVFVAIDGAAPAAKGAQQRQRRFAAARDRAPGGFDSNQLSPGTVFMKNMTLYFHTRIREMISNPPKTGARAAVDWRKIEIIFSPPTVPGEGEHIIMDYIREKLATSTSEFSRQSHCIFGPDGDLIMLTLATHLPRIFLFRKDQFQPDTYDMLDMGLVRQNLAREMGISSRKPDDAINDFVLIGFFVGNDFLPKAQMFMYLRDGLDSMINTYAKMVLASRGDPLGYLTIDGGINHRFFSKFVAEVARGEERFIFSQSLPAATTNWKGEGQEEMFVDRTLLKNIRETPDGRKSLDFSSYRRDYYAKSNIDVGVDDGEVLLRKMCSDYLRTVAFVFDYYTVTLPSWTHFYEWYYPPLMVDLARFMASASKEALVEVYDFPNPGKPLIPFVQLLTILPPLSANLLPKAYRGLLLDADSPLSSQYPATFEVDYEGKVREHMGVVLLPFADVEKTRREYEKIAKKVDPGALENVWGSKWARNRRGWNEIFVYDPDYEAKFESKYGVVEPLKVRKFYV